MSQVSDVNIYELSPEDARAYNEFFAAGAARHPDTLRISPADVRAAPFERMSSADGVTLAGRDDLGAWLGVVTLERELGREKRRHIAWVLRMYVPEASAGKGVGRALLTAALERARQLPGISKVNLTVAEHNVRAVRLYESAGFRAFSREVDAFRDREPRTELTMSLQL
ncbi:MAG: GNAT family N-acetyltransferase [Myxococcales bacterium]|nr:MAG: GNAT family N-acetyltransferase [Myxococcales bacterium]